MAAMGPCVTSSGIHCTLPGCKLADLYENYIAKAYNISVPGMVDSFLKAIARDVTFIIEFFVHVRYFLTLPILPYFVFDMSVTLPGHAAHNISFLMVDEIRQH